jgi:hypothetical protein
VAAEERLVLNFLLTEGEHGWCARCLEYDFVTQADTLHEVYYEIQRTVVGHLEISSQLGQPPFEGLRRAGQEHWEAFERSALSIKPIEFIVRAIPGAVQRQHPIPELRELRVAAAPV